MARRRNDAMAHPVQAAGERGFTLVELLVVVLILGILAAIALPTFLHHGDKARDATAKSDLRNAVSQMESCFRSRELYTGCPDAHSPLAPGVEVDVTPAGDRYTATRRSASGTTFVVRRLAAGYARGCDRAGEAGCRADASW